MTLTLVLEYNPEKTVVNYVLQRMVEEKRPGQATQRK